jgi:hypothetical protein
LTIPGRYGKFTLSGTKQLGGLCKAIASNERLNTVNKYYLVTRKNEVIGWVMAFNFEHAVEQMNSKVGLLTRRVSDCIMAASEYRPDALSNNY